MKAGTDHGICPTCGQLLVDTEMFKRVRRAQAAADKSARARLRGDIEAEVAAKNSASDSRAKARIEDLQHRVDELQRQLDTRGAHDRGIDHELDVLEVLKAGFPTDAIERNGRGGDLLHTVVSGGRDVGLIVYECKNAGTWQNAWVAKLKRDGRKRRTPYLVLVSRRLPARERGVCVRDDVVICEPAYLLPLAAVMRRWVISMQRAEAVATAADSKARRLYAYLAGDEFRADFAEISACASELDVQLAKERGAHERAWVGRLQVHKRLGAAVLTIGANLSIEFEDAVPTHIGAETVSAVGVTDSPVAVPIATNGQGAAR